METRGVAGYRAGSLTPEPHFAPKPRDRSSVRANVDLWMAVADLLGTLVDSGSGSGGSRGLFDSPMLTGKTDAMVVGTPTEAVSGSGADIGASLSWTDAKRGLSGELRGHGLLAHEAKGFRERGFSGDSS